MTKFNTGDIVQLKSGGPSMTIKSLNTEDVLCTWFNGMTKHEDMFQADQLKTYDTPQIYVGRTTNRDKSMW